MTPSSSSEAPPGPSRSSFEPLATLVLAVALVVVALVAILVLPVAFERGSIPTIVALVAVVLAGSLPALALAGLVRWTAWRIGVAVIALWFLVLTGVLDLVAALAAGGLTIPLLAIGALIVLWRRPATSRSVGRGRIEAVAILLGATALLWGPLTSAALRPGSPLVVDETALELRATVDCFASGVAAGPPATITITTTWAWRSTEPVPWGSDSVLVEWQTTSESGGNSATHRLQSVKLPPGATQGEGSPPARDAIEAEQAEQGPMDGNVAFWLDLGTDGMRDGEARVTLAAAEEAPSHGSLFGVATYVHRDAWQRTSTSDTSGENATCFW
jgi:hypothetical protein